MQTSPGTGAAPPPASSAAAAALDGLAEGGSADGLPVERAQAASGSAPRLPRGSDVPGGRGGGACALDEETRDALSALSTRLAEGFCAEIDGLAAPARAAVLRGFLASVREDVGDEVQPYLVASPCGCLLVRGHCAGSWLSRARCPGTWHSL